MTNGLSKQLSKKVVHGFLFSLLFFSLQFFLYPLTASAQTGTFTATGSMITVRYGHTATLLPNGKVLVAAGANNDAPYYLASAELYEPTTGAFTATGSMTTAQLFHTATLLPNGKVLVAGGVNNGSTALSSAALYDPVAGTFTTTGPMNTARYLPTATLLPNGKVLIAGGYNGGYLSSAELYDPATGIFTVTGSMAETRDQQTATLLPNGKVLIAGGVNFSGVLSSAELYDPAAGTFAFTGSMNAARGLFGYEAMLLSNGKVLIAGGINSGYIGLSSAELYDPAAGTFTFTGSMNTGRAAPTATLLANGKVLVATGQENPSVGSLPVTSAELYDPAAGTFTFTGSMITARYMHRATRLNNGTVLVTGGYSGSVVLASAELYISVPTDKDQCKNNGWMTLFMADGSPFKNQGACNQFVK
jgi:WD40 repeat protein